jgi:hypothetical protein
LCTCFHLGGLQTTEEFLKLILISLSLWSSVLHLPVKFIFVYNLEMWKEVLVIFFPSHFFCLMFRPMILYIKVYFTRQWVVILFSFDSFVVVAIPTNVEFHPYVYTIGHFCDGLFCSLFYVSSRIFHSNWDFIITGEGLQK